MTDQEYRLQVLKAQEAADGFEIGMEIEMQVGDDWIPACIVGRSLRGWIILDRADFFYQNKAQRIIEVVKDFNLIRHMNKDKKS